MKVKLPQTKLTIYSRIEYEDKSIDPDYNFIHDGEVPMSEQQSADLKALLGDGKATVTVSREMAAKDYGNGGAVFVSVSLTCDQSQQGIDAAAAWAAHIAEQNLNQQFESLRQALLARGITA